MLLGMPVHQRRLMFTLNRGNTGIRQLTSIEQRHFWGGKPPEPEEFDVKVDLYKPLGLTKGASAKDIKNCYYKLCYEYHPDRAGGMHQDKFKEINNAYGILGNEEKRKKYD